MTKKNKPQNKKNARKTSLPNATRRTFVKSTAALGVGFWAAGGVSAKPSRSALEEIRFACIGIDGKGSSDSEDAKKNGKVVAVCDVDEGKLGGVKSKFEGAKHYTDYRKMLEEMDKSIDAVTVSTPDHTHAIIGLQAMRMGKHCFCQKPLTHSIEESRMMGDVARERKLVTQMGNQGTALSNLRMSAALIRKGIVGNVKEVHVWSNRPVWPQSVGLKIKTEPGKDASPEEVKEFEDRRKLVHWDKWIGPAKMRAYSPEIHPFKWRGFWDFGTGALGDMACHTLNMSYMALDLKFPTSVRGDAADHDGVCYPENSMIEFIFPELNGRPALKMFWYDGGRRPSDELLKDLPKAGDEGDKRHYASAALIVGDKGKFYSPGDYGGETRNTGLIVNGEFINQRRIVKPREETPAFAEFKDLEYLKSPGHFVEFANAIKGEGKTMSNFPDYAGPLSETILLGNLSILSKQHVDWNAKEMIAKDASDEVKKMVRHEYHNGYTIHT